ncbi:UDP-3-O-(3-hydroxymyristoyl)glucosamine N-acyltransferase [Diaphorobacter sp. HDW4B]|uniref:UDP-3-O-(3-hydroxymyristoyl)glucosamine N-acyltransferase n=1 Tax=Diaphorobacter sp. HDW4B TaxID=2714925 RepID=UPI0014091CF0|nr:UDP-3-O-(3-hydroxymyristoyl)glucosamine N-acyltransferase [Diaphorobacter sp. HDW4B]QIL72518.1 UDP-3-O-(3-hydroxymyristoyl)glucosamine N-acyltransferase [Diaphorobacter sp. HDW4B]
MSLRLGQIINELGGSLEGASAEVEISRIAPLETAGPGELAFLNNPRYQSQLAASRAACVIVAPAMRDAALARGACIVTPDPYVYFARVTQLWKREHATGDKHGIHPSAVVDPEAFVDPTAFIGPLCVVERGARIGANTVLKARVNVGERCVIGDRCILHPGVVIGADGFGFAPERGDWVKIEQLGAVRIGNDVEIGANTCIDRGALEDTVIEDSVKLDNLIQIAHNVHIGHHTAMAGCTAVAGSTKIGAHCMIAGAASIIGHLQIADNVHISTNTVVMRSIPRAGHYTGVFPFDDNANWEKNAATLRQLYKLRERVKALEQTIKNDG